MYVIKLLNKGVVVRSSTVTQMSGLEGKLCLITGGTRGIGKAAVELFGASHAKVYTCSRNQAELDELLSSCSAKGWNVKGCVCDVGNKESLKQMIENVKACFDGKLNVLVNNAGLLVMKKVIDFSDDEYHKLMNVNVESVYHLCRMCYPLLKASGNGSIVNIGSVNGGPRPACVGVPYVTTKGALHQFTRCLSCEWAAENIRVNCVAPGFTDTPMTADLMQDKEFVELWGRETPLTRVGQPEDIAKAIKFFATDDSSFVTGQVLHVDGGYSVRGLGY